MKKDPFKIKNRPGIKTPVHRKSNVYKKLSDKEIHRLVKRARAVSIQIDEIRPLYKELDEITAALLNIKSLKQDGAINRHGVAIVDNFADKDTAFRTVGIRRYELKWVRK